MTIWILIAGAAALTVAIKAAGPLVLGGRELPPRTAKVIALLPPVLLAALVVTSTISEGRHIELDASVVGVGVGALLIWRRCPLLLAVVVAAAVTAGIRALG